MTLGAFGVVTLLSERQRDADLLDGYRGLFWRRPALALVFTAVLSVVGGYTAEPRDFSVSFISSRRAPAAGAWALILILVTTSAIGLFYYLRIVVVLYQRPAESDRAHEPIPRRAPAATLVLAALTVILVLLGVYPTPLLRVIQTAIESVG